jgi:hypothetical protein
MWFRISDADAYRHVSSLWELICTHEFTDQILQEIPVIELILTPYQIVTDARKWDEVDPYGVRMSLLEGCWDESGGYIRIEREDACIITVWTADRTCSRRRRSVGPSSKKEVQCPFVGKESSEDIVLDKVKQVVGRKGEYDSRRCKTGFAVALGPLIDYSDLVCVVECR